jgi:hypothetical protein
MTDTPQDIKDLQLKLWLSKTPGERLYQFLIDNDKMYQGLLALKKAKAEKENKKETGENSDISSS